MDKQLPDFINFLSGNERKFVELLIEHVALLKEKISLLEERIELLKNSSSCDEDRGIRGSYNTKTRKNLVSIVSDISNMIGQGFTKKTIYEILSKKYDVSPRTLRRITHNYGMTRPYGQTDELDKILSDIKTGKRTEDLSEL